MGRTPKRYQVSGRAHYDVHVKHAKAAREVIPVPDPRATEFAWYSVWNGISRVSAWTRNRAALMKRLHEDEERDLVRIVVSDRHAKPGRKQDAELVQQRSTTGGQGLAIPAEMR